MRILITGARSGIGYRLGVDLVHRGHSVYFTTHTDKELITLKEKLKEEKIDALCFKMDITTDDIKLVDNLKIDVLICNAAIGIGGSLLYMNTDRLRENYEVNIFSTISLIKRVYNNMEKDNIQGKIFVMSSLLGYFSIPFLGCYSSSKAALSNIVKTIRMELDYLNSNINICLVELGAYKTGFNQVMIDNKTKYLEENNIIYNNSNSINIIQRNLFSLLESKKINVVNNKIIKNIESDNPKFLIKEPQIFNFIIKLYLLFN